MTEEIKTENTHDDHARQSIWSKYIFSLDHKMIAKQYLLLGITMLALGGLLAMLIRWQLGYPEEPLPIIGLSDEYMETGEAVGTIDKMWDNWFENETENWFTSNIPGGVIGPEFYNALFTMHATIMIFFAIMPILIGCFGNFLIPLMIGTKDMAFPFLNMLSFWVAFIASIVMLSGFFVPGGHAAAGWTGYPPLSASAEFTGVEWGQNLWIIGLLLIGISSMMGAINYITTIINMRTKGMTFFRLPLTVWSLFIVAILLLLAVPVLASALAMLLFDNMFGTSFFSAAGGGDPILWQHLFWFFGHPEVYVLILPGMGIASDLLSVFARKPIFGYKAMVYAMISIAGLGFIVWGHHMFQSGMNPGIATTFMFSTMVIAVPSAIKTFNWLGTLKGANIKFTVPMMNTLAFVSMFVIGGLSGIFMASTPVDIFIHDTYFIVAHIHYVIFGGSIFALFAAVYYWFPKMFGRGMNMTLGKIHFWMTFIFFNATFFPMHILGVGGHMRRIYNPMQYEFLQDMQWINEFITVSAMMLGFVQILFFFNFFYSMYWGKVAEDNPWQANTLEWFAPTPPPHGNFPTQPIVYGGPYEYSLPDKKEDWLSQAAKR